MSFLELETFLAAHGHAFRLAISGGAKAGQISGVFSWLQTIVGPLRNEHILAITGGTRSGVPGAAACVTHRELGLPILGVLPERGQEYAASEFTDADPKLGEACLVTVPPVYGVSMWGDESPLFVRLADAILVLGGEWGTTVELALALKVNVGRVEKRKPPIHIVPVEAFPGPAQYLASAPWISDEVRHASFPSQPLESVEAVTQHLRTLLALPRHRP